MPHGQQNIVIDFTNFARGASPSADINNGGFSPQSDNINLIAQLGILNATGQKTDKKTNLTDEIIASAEDPTYLGVDRVFLDDSGAFYTYNGTSLTKPVTASGDLFTRGTTDMVAWQNDADGLQFYITTKAGSNGDIVQWNKSTTLDEDWWTGGGGLSQAALSANTAWRPLLVFERNLYIGDKNALHRVLSDGTTANANLLVLSSEKTISALGFDPSTGLMLVAFTTGVDISASRNGQSFIGIYDGFSNKLRKIVPINGTVTSFKSVDGYVYVFYGNKLGVWTGASVRFLRTLDFSIGTASNLVYPHRVTSIDNTMYFCSDSDKVMAYGEIVQGEKVFYPVIKDTGGYNISCLANVGGNILGYSYDDTSNNRFQIVNVTSIAQVNGDGANFYSNRFSFPRPVNIRSMEIYYKTAIDTGSDAIGTVKFIDDKGTTTTVKSITQGSASQKVVRTESVGIKTTIAQLLYTFAPATATDVNGIEKFIIYYDFAE